MRRLLLILFLSWFAAPAYTQSSNPTVAACGLPAEGTIVATVTYTLSANCTQTGTLEIKTAETTNNITLTINGSNKTISIGNDERMNFLVADDQGVWTPFNNDDTASPNVKIIIKNVTFDGNGRSFASHRYHNFDEDGNIKRNEDGNIQWSETGIGSAISAEGTLEMENVTFTDGNGSWLRAEGTATLNNVLFEDSWVLNYGSGSTIKGALHVTKTGSATLQNAVFRDTARVVIAIEKGGSLSTTGCLSFIRVWTHKVHHSGIFGELGTWSDSSTGACTGAIGNGGQAVVAYTPSTMPCGLPSGGTIEGEVVYTLTQPCVCVNTVNIAAGANVTINANGNRIEGCSSGTPVIRIGNAQVTINNAVIDGIQVINYGGTFSLIDSVVTQTYRWIRNYGWTYLINSVFENNLGRGDGRGKVYYAHGWFDIGRALFRDNIFRNNKPAEDKIEAYTTGSSTAIYLCGDNIFDGDIPTSIARFLMAVDGGGIFGCNDNHPLPASAAVECVPEYTNLPANKPLGAIGIIFYKQKCPSVIEIWEVLPNSQGQFALKVSQNDIEAVAEGLVACSSNGRAAVRVGLPEPVRQQIVHSRAYQAVSPRKARDILISLGPNIEGKVNHIVIDNALNGQVLGTVSTYADEPPCQGASLSGLLAAAAAAPQPTAIPFAAPVFPQPAQEDGSIVHVVQPGDTIWQIGIAYDVHPYKIIALNQLDQLRNRGRYIFPGQELLIREAG